MKTGLLFTMLFVLLSVGASAQIAPSCDSIVKKVTFENTNGLNPEQTTRLSKLLMGRCFQREHPEVLSEAVYRQLRAWGFKQPTVYDPDHGHAIQVLDDTVTPKPVAVAIDFRVVGLDKFK